MRGAVIVAAVVVAGAISSTTGLSADVDQLAEEDFEVRTGRDLLEICNPPGGHQYARDAIHMCHGIVLGAYGVHEAVAPRLGRVVCPPQNASRSDGVRTFVSWAQAHPTSLDEPAIDALFRAWEANYPCK